ncbi:MAG: tetratricopeptide repeat protein [Thermoflexales bacterium]|nr:tetratricopeptide repeat protein [Thermoflexales bacterium]
MADRGQLEQTIAALEAHRALLGDLVVDTAVAPLRQQLAALQERPAGDQRKMVTILFADVSGFTAMSETMDAEEVRDTMNDLWARLDGAITAQGGFIDKHIGDAIMALFGAPTAREDDAERAIRAALAMQKEIERWNTDRDRDRRERGDRETAMGRPSLSDISISMRIGVNTGPVLLGEVGTTAEYTAMGDAVNLASRLEHAAPVGGILISHDTHRHVRGVFEVQALEPLKVKGKVEPVQVYVVKGLRPRSFRATTRGVEGVETRMIGREADLACLQDAFRSVMEKKQAQVVTVVAEAGVGKSRLLHEFTHWLEEEGGGLSFFKARADEQAGRLPYALARGLFTYAFHIQDSDEAALACKKFEAGVAGLLAEGGLEKAHFIGYLLGFDFREASSPYLQGLLGDPRQIRDRAFGYVAQFFAAAAADRPAVVFLEDIHWADDGSLDMAEHVARECHAAPLLLVCIARPSLFERRAGWGKAVASMHTRLDVHPLSEEDSRQLVAEILRKVSNVPPALRDLVVSRAEGNPFYVEELIKMLIEDGVIVKGEEQWSVQAEQLEGARVPPTLTGVLQARLDGLVPVERGALQKASVVGRTFWDAAVARLGEGQPEAAAGAERPEALGARLDALQARELVFERDRSAFARAQEYIFKHAILRDVTYESVLLRLRRVYHAQAAAWLIEQARERVGEYAGLIGEHYERAGQAAEAVEWYRRAGRQAQDAYAPEAAVEYYQRALALLSPAEGAKKAQLAQRIELYKGMGEVLRWQARFAEAQEAFEAMRTAAEAAGDAPGRAYAWNELALVQEGMGDYRAMLDSALQAEDTARNAGGSARAELARALSRKGMAFYRLGEMETALSLGKEALALNTDLNNRREMAICLNLLATARIALGDYERATQHYEEVLALCQAIGNRAGVMTALNNLGEIARIRGDYRSAVKLYQDGLTTAREIGRREAEMLFLSNLAGARIGLGEGEYPAAEADLCQAIRMAGAGGEVAWWLPEAYSFLAQACIGQAKLDEALIAAQQALALSKELESQEHIGLAWRTLGLVMAAPPAWAEGQKVGQDPVACFAESLRVFAEAGMEGERAQTLRAWAAYELEQGDKARGQAMWQEAHEIFTRLGMTGEAERMSGANRP